MRQFIALSLVLCLSCGQNNAKIGDSNYEDGGIFTSGYVSDEPEFGNTFSAQSLLPSYDASPRGEGRQNTGGKKGGGGGRPGGKRGGGGQQRTDGIDMLRKSVPGVPGQDYPIYGEVPETSFSCNGQIDGGYYADTEAQCQVFHVCTSDARGGLSKYSFLCPNGTIFNQFYFICDWWFNFDCSEAPTLYSLNAAMALDRDASTKAILSASPKSKPSSNNKNKAPANPPSIIYGTQKPQGSTKSAGGSYQSPNNQNFGNVQPSSNNYLAPISPSSNYNSPKPNQVPTRQSPQQPSFGPNGVPQKAPSYTFGEEDLPTYGK